MGKKTQLKKRLRKANPPSNNEVTVDQPVEEEQEEEEEDYLASFEFQELPRDVIFHIFCLVDRDDLLNLALVNRFFCSIASGDFLWQLRMDMEYPALVDEHKDDCSDYDRDPSKKSHRSSTRNTVMLGVGRAPFHPQFKRDLIYSSPFNNLVAQSNHPTKINFGLLSKDVAGHRNWGENNCRQVQAPFEGSKNVTAMAIDSGADVSMSFNPVFLADWNGNAWCLELERKFKKKDLLRPQELRDVESVWYSGGKFVAHRGPISAMAVLRNSFTSQTLFTASFDRTIKIWDYEYASKIIEEEKEERRLLLKRRVVMPRSFCHRELKIAPKAALDAHAYEISDLRVDYRQGLMISSSQDKTIKLWDIETLKCISTLQCGALPTCLDYSVEGELIAAGTTDSRAIFWDARTGQVASTIDQLQAPLDAMCMHNYFCCLAPKAKTLSLYDIRKSWTQFTAPWIEKTRSGILCMKPDSGLMACCSGGATSFFDLDHERFLHCNTEGPPTQPIAVTFTRAWAVCAVTATNNFCVQDFGEYVPPVPSKCTKATPTQFVMTPEYKARLIEEANRIILLTGMRKKRGIEKEQKKKPQY